MSFKKYRLFSFTIVEIIVVIGVLGLTLPVLFAIIFSILRQQVKIYRLAEIKRQGDYGISVVENTIRNYATKIYSEQSLTNEQCASTGSSYSNPNGTNFFFKDKFNRWFNFYQSNDRISSNSPVLLSAVDLTSDKVKIGSFTISCNRSATYSPPVVSFNFNICYKTQGTSCGSPRPEETATMTYQIKVKLRSF